MPPSRRSFLIGLSAVPLLGRDGRKLTFTLSQAGGYQQLPAGSVESYAIHSRTGHSELLSRQSLSLSATMPRSLAVSPDGRFLVVAAYGGGIYNVLPVSSDGKIGEVSQVWKELGSSVHPEHQKTSHPHSVVFHPSGKFLLATDLGADRITVFGVSNGRLTPALRINTPPGTGPGELKMDATGSRVTVRYELKPGIAHYHFDSRTGVLA